jgi:hypothetical protein
MIPPSGDDLPTLPPPEERQSSDYEDAYLALLDVHTPVAVRLALLQAYVRRVLLNRDAETEAAGG